jgi:tetratricopeptide (TPR) repeat protein
MAQRATDARLLVGHKVAFTGQLASMTRRQAAILVRACGGEWLATVTRRMSMLVIGQDGWPLDKNGRLTRKLQKARRLERVQPIAILSEADFLARLGLDSPSRGVQRLSTSQLSRVLRVSGDRIRSWIQQGLVQPSETLHGVHYFDFQQARWAKSLCDFARAGVAPQRIRRSLEQLTRWMPDVQRPLAQLAMLEKDGRLVVRLGEGQLADPTGQGLFDFSDQPAMPSETGRVPLYAERRTQNAERSARAVAAGEQWFDLGRQHEQAGNLAEAAKAYLQALESSGQDAYASFNLANVLHALGQKEQAAKHFHQAVQVDASFVDAWNNLGVVLSELGQYEEAVLAFQRAIALSPYYADARYNLADTLDQLGREEEALPHWRAYARLDPTSPWGAYARRRLKA